MIVFRKATRDVSIVAGSHLVMWLATFVFTAAQARFLGPTRFGELSLALAYTAFFTFVVDFGLTMQLSRLVAERRENVGEAIGATFVLRVVLWALTLPIAWLAATVLGYSPELRDAMLVLTGSVLLMGLGSTIAAVLQGREEFVPISLASIAYRLGAAVVGVVALFIAPTLGAVAAAFVFAAAANLAVLVLALRTAAFPPVRISAAATAAILRSAVPLGLYWIVGTFYFNVDMAMLQRLAPPENVGWYAAAYRLFSTGLVVPGIVTAMVLFPVLSRLSVHPNADLRAVITKALAALAPLGCAAAVIMVILAEGIVGIVYPIESFAPAASALRLLAPALVLVYVNSVLAYTLFALHQERRLLRMAAAAAVLNPLANLVAIPIFREDGAAAVTSLTEVFLLVCLVRMMPTELKNERMVQVVARSLAAAAITAIVLIPIRNDGLLLTLPIALIAYVLAALGVGAISMDEVRAVRALLAPIPRAQADVLAGEPVLAGTAKDEVR